MGRFCAGGLDEDQTWSLWCVHTVDVLEMACRLLLGEDVGETGQRAAGK